MSSARGTLRISTASTSTSTSTLLGHQISHHHSLPTVPIDSLSSSPRPIRWPSSPQSTTMLAVYVFLIIFTGQLVNWVGKTRLNDWTHNVFLFVTRSPMAKKQRSLRTTILKTKVELQATSSQDEFAKWARLRRKMDKEIAELDTLNKHVAAARVQFSSIFSSLLWAFTTGLQFVLVSWYRKSPVFFLPQDWFPPLVLWVLSFPSAPYGAVSTTVWTMVCKRALLVCGTLVSDCFGLFFGSPPEQEQPVAESKSNTQK